MSINNQLLKETSTRSSQTSKSSPSKDTKFHLKRSMNSIQIIRRTRLKWPRTPLSVKYLVNLTHSRNLSLKKSSVTNSRMTPSRKKKMKKLGFGIFMRTYSRQMFKQLLTRIILLRHQVKCTPCINTTVIHLC